MCAAQEVEAAEEAKRALQDQLDQSRKMAQMLQLAAVMAPAGKAEGEDEQAKRKGGRRRPRMTGLSRDASAPRLAPSRPRALAPSLRR